MILSFWISIWAFRLRRRAFRYIFVRSVTISLPTSASVSNIRPRFQNPPPLAKDAAPIPNASAAYNKLRAVNKKRAPL